MTEPDDPARLFDAPGTPEGLKHALRDARADVGSPAQVARLAERLGPLLGAGAVAGGSAGAVAGKAALGGAAKAGLIALAVVAGGGGAYFLMARSPEAPSAISHASPSAPAPRQGAALPAIADAAPPTASIVAEPPPPVASAAPARSIPDRLNAPVRPSEAELLEQARSALKTDPGRALQRASEHARRFPRGVLVQEREVLAIQALQRLGREAEAERRAEAFAKAFPGSPFQRRLKPIP